MPANRLVDPIDIGQYDVVGMDSENEPEFVRHLAMSFVNVRGHSRSEPLHIAHMGPPLEIGANGRVQTLGVLPLTQGERQSINLFIADLDLERRAQIDRLNIQSKNARRAERIVGSLEYCIRPSQDMLIRQFHGREIQLRRFSCAGFVLAAYEDAGIILLDTDEYRLPEVHLKTLCAAYPDQESQLLNSDQRANYNLQGSGPWRVVLAGYVINALAGTNPNSARPRANLPYRPQPGDEYYPPRRGGTMRPKAIATESIN